MDLISLTERIGEAPAAALFGMLTGTLFGVAAQRSRFCLRAATVEVARGRLGNSVAIWGLTFSTALFWVQIAQLLEWMNAADARMMAVPGSWSGAILGGLLFGAGMVLARGCSGRLLVLAATGNLRSVVSGLIFAVVAQMSLSGALAPVRDYLASLWITSGGRNLDLLVALGLSQTSGMLLGLASAVAALALAWHNRIGPARLIFASAVALGWVLTYALSQIVFDPIQIESATFTGPSADMLMYALDGTGRLDFGFGLVPGVFLGAFLAAWIAGELRFQAFDGPVTMRKAMIGAAMMGFGGMLAGGCAIGAGVSGGSIFAGTAWCALLFMWVGAMLSDLIIDRHGNPVPA